MTSSAKYDAIIIGGGLAGAGTALALAKRSLKVLLCEAQPALAAKASGNARGLLMPYIATHLSPPERLYARGFDFTYNLLTTTLSNRGLYTECGAIQLPATKRLSRLLAETEDFVGEVEIKRVSTQEGCKIAGVTLCTPSLYIPKAGYCQPAQVTRALVEASNPATTVRCSLMAVDINWEGSTWRVAFSDGTTLSTPNVVLCGAHEISKLPLTAWVPLEPIRGQSVQAVGTADSLKLRTVILYDGYITPSQEGLHFIGTHYRHNDMSEEPREDDTDEMVSRLYRTLPDLRNLSVHSSRVCFRTSTHDRMPYIGALPTSRGSGLYINAGHGGRGLITAPLGGEIIARIATGVSLEDLEEAAQVSSASRLQPRFANRSLPNKCE